MTAHSELGASGASRWMACPASVRMTRDLPDTRSAYAEEGTAAHALAERCLRQARRPDAFLGQTFAEAPGVVVDKQMVDYVEQYLDYVQGLPGVLFIEQRVDYSHIVPGGFGTADALVTNGDTLYVVDLKYGQGVRVDAVENPQLMLYALGALDNLDWLGDVARVVLVVHQPRLDHVSEWETTPEALHAFGQKAREAAELALSEDPPFGPGEACRWCRAAGNCRAQAEYNLATARAEFGPPVAFDKLSDEELAEVLARLPALRNWANQVEERALTSIMRGEPLPGWKVVEGRSLRRWAEDDALAPALEAELGDDAWKRDLISPAQAEKLLGKKHTLLAQYVTKPPGKPTLAPEADKRPPFKLAEAQHEFTTLPEEA